MSREKKILPTYKIYAPSDLSKRWFVYWNSEGKRYKRYGSINRYKTKEKRQAQAQQLIAELKAESLRRVTKVELTVRRYIAASAPKWSNRTVEQYSSVSNVFFEWLSGQELTQPLLEEFFKDLLKKLHPTTYNKYLEVLKRLLTQAGYEFFFYSLKKAKANPTPARYFQRHQAKLLLERIDKADEELGLFVRLMYYCFIRPNELRFLKVGDVLLEEGEIRIPGNVSKNSKTQFIVIPDQLQDYLYPLYRCSPGAYIFPSPKDFSKPMGKHTMYGRHKRILDKLNFGEGYTLYSWKHTGAVAAAKAGISVKELQLQLRHHSLDETDKYLRQMGVKDLAVLKREFPGIL